MKQLRSMLSSTTKEKAIGHREDIRREMSDAEIITTALVAAMFFNGNHSKACDHMRDHKLTRRMLEKSRL